MFRILKAFSKYYGTITFGALSGTAGILYERSKITPVSAKVLIQPSDLNDVKTNPDNVKVSAKAPEIMKFGYPLYDGVKKMNDFVLSYDHRLRTARWVFERLTREDFNQNSVANRADCEFFEDKTVHKFFRATNRDYQKTGYDRGHLAAAGNHKVNQEDCKQTFVLSNISPQVGPGFNRDMWNSLERYVRKLTKSYKYIYVCTGPLFLSRKEPDGRFYIKYEVIGHNQVAVPTHFFKVIVCETANNEYDLEAFVLPNQAINATIPLKNFHVPVESIERAAGFLLFDKIPRSAFRRINLV